MSNEGNPALYTELIDRYYNDIISCVRFACVGPIPSKSSHCAEDIYIIPGWNDYVNDAHVLARESFLNWVDCGKPQQGFEYMAMKQHRSNFKLALRRCRRYVDMIRADACAESLSNKD